MCQIYKMIVCSKINLNNDFEFCKHHSICSNVNCLQFIIKSSKFIGNFHCLQYTPSFKSSIAAEIAAEKTLLYNTSSLLQYYTAASHAQISQVRQIYLQIDNTSNYHPLWILN